MTTRLVSAILLACFATAIKAEVFVYAIEGYLVSEKVGADPSSHFPASFRPAQRFEGSIIFDTERTQTTSDGWLIPAPIASISLVNQAGDTITASDLSTSINYQYGVDLEHLAFPLIAAEGRYDRYFEVNGTSARGRIELDWSTTELGQLPLEPTDNASEYLPHVLTPNSWTIEVTNNGACSVYRCDADAVSSIKGHITRLGFGALPDYNQEFDSTPSDWIASTGEWNVLNGEYRNGANVSFTPSILDGVELAGDYRLDVDMYSQWSAPGNTLGIVLHYQDGTNFDEIRFNTAGVVTYSRISAGKRTVLRTGQAIVQGPRTWFAVHVTRDGSNVQLRVDAQDVFTVDAGALTGGRAGVFASWNLARFDNFRLEFQPPAWRVTRHDFGVSSDSWTAVAGDWEAVDGYYYASSNLPVALATSSPVLTSNYTIDASLYLEWSNTGNRAGIVYDYVDASNYRAVLVSASREAQGGSPAQLQVIEVVNGVRRTVQGERTYADGLWVLPRQRVPLGVRRIGALTEIMAFGYRIVLNQAEIEATKRVGLITQYNKVRFDDVVIGERPE